MGFFPFRAKVRQDFYFRSTFFLFLIKKEDLDRKRWCRQWNLTVVNLFIKKEEKFLLALSLSHLLCIKITFEFNMNKPAILTISFHITTLWQRCQEREDSFTHSHAINFLLTSIIDFKYKINAIAISDISLSISLRHILICMVW